jgi:hypothetical protein
MKISFTSWYFFREHRIRQRHITLEIPDPGLGQAQTCGGVKPDNVMRSLKGCS